MVASWLTRVRASGIGALAAAGSIALALPNGGYYPRATAIATLIVWWVVLVGCASGVLPRSKLTRAAAASIGLLAALAAWAALSLLWSENAGSGLIDVVRIAGYAGLGAALLLSARPGFARQLLAGLALGVTVVVVIGLLSRCFPHLFTTERGDLADRSLTASGRLSFPLGYWNAFGGIAALDIVLLLGFAVTARRRWVRASVGALVALPVLAIFLTSSRGAVICGAVGALALFVFADRRERWIAAAVPPLLAGGVLVLLANSRQAFVEDLANSSAVSEGHQMAVLAVLAVAVATAVAFLVDYPVRGLSLPRLRIRYLVAALIAVAIIGAVATDLPRRVDSFKQLPARAASSGGVGHLLSDGSSGRWQYWSTAVHAFRDEPIKGIGAGGYPSYWDKNGAIAVPLQNAHSLPLETAAELGLIGVLLLAAAALVTAVEGARRMRRDRSMELVVAMALLAAVASQAMIDWTWQVPAVFSIAIAAAAIVLGPRPGDEASPDSGGLAAGIELRVVGVLAAVVAIGCAGLQLLGQTKIDSARSALAAGSYGRALDEANGGVSIEGFSSVPRLQQALAYEGEGRLSKARAAIDEAISRAPQDWTLQLVAHRIALDQGDETAAFEAMERMRHLRPPIASSADAG